MLFSREDVATFIQQNFEPAWEMVRPVPIVRIDFGNGRVTTRTLHGNVASYVCAADGQVVDIVPGIYTPVAFMTALRQPRALAVNTAAHPDRILQLQGYHREQAQRLRNPRPAPAVERVIRDVGKGRIERRVEQQLVNAQTLALLGARNAQPRNAAQLANWLPLVEDTRRNETERRLQIHDRLAQVGAVQPEQIKRWLYRDVLHADLDDPHMGLGDDFFTAIEG